jgi:hypothetical protein
MTLERHMGRFRHPHASRGFVYTSKGAFAVVRGVVEAPDEVGELFGWVRVDESDVAPATNSRDDRGASPRQPAR